jgi:hypothetical protein
VIPVQVIAGGTACRNQLAAVEAEKLPCGRPR